MEVEVPLTVVRVVVVRLSNYRKSEVDYTLRTLHAKLYTT